MFVNFFGLKSCGKAIVVWPALRLISFFTLLFTLVLLLFSVSPPLSLLAAGAR